MTLEQLIRQATKKLNTTTPRLDAQVLLQHVLGLDKTQLFLKANETVSSEDQKVFEDLIEQRAKGVPVAYLVGQQDFWSLTLKVNASVLVPRADTELVVEKALEWPKQACTMIDLGTGSGAIACALALEKPHWQVCATDLSTNALAVAKANAMTHELGVLFHRGHWLQAVQSSSMDMIVSNPPYIENNDPHLSELVHEPLEALVADHQGLSDIQQICEQAYGCLKPEGWLLVEHGFEQGEPVRDIFRKAGFVEVETFLDLAGLERVTKGVRGS